MPTVGTTATVLDDGSSALLYVTNSGSRDATYTVQGGSPVTLYAGSTTVVQNAGKRVTAQTAAGTTDVDVTIARRFEVGLPGSGGVAPDDLDANVRALYGPASTRRELTTRRTIETVAAAPTVTLSAANAATSITGSTLRAPLVNDGTNVDMAADPSFLWSHTPSMTNGAGGSASIFRAALLTGTTSSIRYQPRVTFAFYGDKFEYAFRPFNSFYDYRLMVDGKYVTEHAQRLTVTSGSDYRLLVDFGSVGFRTVSIDMSGSGFQGVAALPAHTVMRAQAFADVPTVVLGDSITAGAGTVGATTGYGRSDSWISAMAHILGWRDVRNTAISGTGFVNAASEAAFTSRLADFQQGPCRYVTYAGLNDAGSVATTLPGAIDTVLSAIAAQSPAEVVVFGCHPINGSSYGNNGYVAVNALLKAKAAQHGAKFIDTFALKPFTGTGNVASPNGSGNADLFVQSDNLHPTRAGSQHLGRVYADAYAALLPTLAA